MKYSTKGRHRVPLVMAVSAALVATPLMAGCSSEPPAQTDAATTTTSDDTATAAIKLGDMRFGNSLDSLDFKVLTEEIGIERMWYNLPDDSNTHAIYDSDVLLVLWGKLCDLKLGEAYDMIPADEGNKVEFLFELEDQDPVGFTFLGDEVYASDDDTTYRVITPSDVDWLKGFAADNAITEEEHAAQLQNAQDRQAQKDERAAHKVERAHDDAYDTSAQLEQIPLSSANLVYCDMDDDGIDDIISFEFMDQGDEAESGIVVSSMNLDVDEGWIGFAREVTKVQKGTDDKGPFLVVDTTDESGPSTSVVWLNGNKLDVVVL